MKKGKRLLCFGAVLSIFCTNVVFAAEFIPPNPLTGGGSLSTEIISQGPGFGIQNPGNENSGNGQDSSELIGPGGKNENHAGNEGSGTVSEGPGAVNGNGDASGNGTTSGSSLEGTVFAGSDQVAAPVVQAEGAVLLNCGTGQILFGKNADQQFYPASITKVMTALLTIENCSLSDIVTFSEAATTNLESGAVTINLTAGDQLTVEQSLHALLLKSANEVANGLAEHISGSVSAFADKMNQRAAQLGCKNTHFANPNGLNNSTHKTTPYDMALIARAAYANPDISRISTTLTYQMPATKNGAAKTITMGHKMNYSTDSRYYPGMVGGKTGYTSKAGNTLVTCVERDGVRLAAVVMKASGTHYTDTKAMLDYGFALAAAGELERGAGSQSEPGSQGTAGGSTQETGVNPSEPAAPAQTGWVQEGNVWSYRKADGSKAAGEWLTINGEAYYFHSSGQMAANTWVRDGEKWLYAGSSGKMLKNTVTPDGYQVGTDGVWIP